MTTARPTRRTARVALVAAAAVSSLALAACTTSGKEDPGLGPDPSVSSTPSATESTGPTGSASPTGTPVPTPDGFSMDEQASPAWPELGGKVGIGVESRVGKNEGYDRVVYQFSRDATPNYRVHWVDEPLDDASGEPRDVPGAAWLEVLVTSVDVPGESAPSPDDPLPNTLEGTVIAAAPAIWGGFEGYGQQFIGVRDQQRPFRVTVLQDPTRLVVDIAH